jgi:hypothetical protein
MRNRLYVCSTSSLIQRPRGISRDLLPGSPTHPRGGELRSSPQHMRMSRHACVSSAGVSHSGRSQFLGIEVSPCDVERPPGTPTMHSRSKWRSTFPLISRQAASTARGAPNRRPTGSAHGARREAPGSWVEGRQRCCGARTTCGGWTCGGATTPARRRPPERRTGCTTRCACRGSRRAPASCSTPPFSAPAGGPCPPSRSAAPPKRHTTVLHTLHNRSTRHVRRDGGVHQ